MLEEPRAPRQVLGLLEKLAAACGACCGTGRGGRRRGGGFIAGHGAEPGCCEAGGVQP